MLLVRVGAAGCTLLGPGGPECCRAVARWRVFFQAGRLVGPVGVGGWLVLTVR